MREKITLNLKSRFHPGQIRLMWQQFYLARERNPQKDLVVIPGFTDIRTQQEHEVWVKVDNNPDGNIATMLLPEDY